MDVIRDILCVRDVRLTKPQFSLWRGEEIMKGCLVLGSYRLFLAAGKEIAVADVTMIRVLSRRLASDSSRIMIPKA